MSLEKAPIKSTYVDEAKQLVISIEKVLDDAHFTPERKAREGFQLESFSCLSFRSEMGIIQYFFNGNDQLFGFIYIGRFYGRFF